jgi:hypothetical protein
MSHAATMSTASPYATPCTAAMTGTGQRSGAEMARWKARMCARSWCAVRAGSVGAAFNVARWLTEERERQCVDAMERMVALGPSMPAEKSLGRAEASTTARTSCSSQMVSKMRLYSSQNLRSEKS